MWPWGRRLPGARQRGGRQGYLEYGRAPLPQDPGSARSTWCPVHCACVGAVGQKAPGGPDPHSLGASRQADSEGT